MVDLVKLRKKAKGGRRSEPAREPKPDPESTGRVSRVGDQQSEPAATLAPTSLPASTPLPIPDPRQPAVESLHEDKLARFREQAGRKRVGFIEGVAEASAADHVELLTFALAGEQYAVSIDHIVEIVTPRGTTHVPNADPSIVGIISLRGTIVTVIDVRRKLGHPPGAGGNDARTIVAERDGETLGFEVDRVLRVLKVGTAAIEPHPIVHVSEQSEAIRGVFRHADALTILLDLDKLLA
jgi:purine-binding chemotaxis protein CheW